MADTYMVFIDIHRCVEVVAATKQEAETLAREQLEREAGFDADVDMEVVDVILVEEV